MIAYRVYIEGEMGDHRDVRYFADMRSAFNDHYERVQAAKQRTDLADSNDLDGREPIRMVDDPFRVHSLITRVYVWVTWSNENGTESEIIPFDIIMDEIEIQEASADE